MNIQKPFKQNNRLVVFSIIYAGIYFGAPSFAITFIDVFGHFRGGTVERETAVYIGVAIGVSFTVLYVGTLLFGVLHLKKMIRMKKQAPKIYFQKMGFLEKTAGVPVFSEMKTYISNKKMRVREDQFFSHPNYTNTTLTILGSPLRLVGYTFTVNQQLPRMEIFDRLSVPLGGDYWDRELSGDVIDALRKDNEKFFGIGQDKVHLESVDFHSVFYVYSEDELRAYQILDPDTMSDLIDIQKELDMRIYCMIEGRNVFVGIEQSAHTKRINSEYTDFNLLNDMHRVFAAFDLGS